MSLHAERGPSSTKRDADLTGGDSSILRYIKTLTSHQTNAKQQRMDRYMQKVKYGRTNDLVKNVKPTGYNHQYELKPYMLKDNVPVPQFSKGKPPTQNVNLDNSKSTAQSELRVQGGETKPRKRLKSKRPYEGNQFKNSKRKKTKRKKQVVAVDSFDRFRFNRTRSPGRSQKSLSKTPQQSAASKLPGSTREALFNLQEPEFTGVTSIQQQATNPHPLMTFRVLTQAAASDPWSNSNQNRFQSPKEIPSGNLQCAIPQQEVAAPAYEHLVPIMESIFF